MTRLWCFLALGFLAVAPVCAHNGFDADTSVQFRPDRLTLVIRIPSPQVRVFLGSDAPALLDDQGYAEIAPKLRQRAGSLYKVAAAGVPLAPLDASFIREKDDSIAITINYPRPARGPLRLEENISGYFGEMFQGRISVFDLTSADSGDAAEPFAGAVQVGPSRPFEVALPGSAPSGREESSPRQPPTLEFIKMGIEHILTGYDHLLFLLALLVTCRRIRTMLGIVTSFTVAHSLTLALAALNVVYLPSAFVEPAIAASIVLVGLENIFTGEDDGGRKPVFPGNRNRALARLCWPRRWQLAFAFGLIHGFGFATALRETGLGANGSPILGPLFAFNVGIEIGQLAVAVVAMPIFIALRRSGIGRPSEQIISVCVVLAGGYWFLSRTIF